jgi:DHA1 family tetracycline resistance protein-like MFS transporter
MASYSLAQFIAAPFWGRLSDRIGRRPVLIVSLAGGVLSYLWLAFAPTLLALFAARSIAGLMAGNIATAFAYVADITTPAERSRGMGLIGAGFGLGFILGPAIGGLLAGNDPANADYQSPALAAAMLSAIALGLAILLLQESLPADVRARHRALSPRHRWQAFRAAVAHPAVGRLITITFLATAVFAGMETTFAMWSRRQFGWGPEQNGYLFALVGLVSAGIQGGVVGRLARLAGEGRLVVAGAIALAAGMLLIPQSTSLALLVPAMLIVAAGFSLLTPSLNSLISLRADATMQGGMMGISRSASTLARVLGPMSAGALFAAFGKDSPFYGGTMVMLAVVVLAWLALADTRDGDQPRSRA